MGIDASCKLKLCFIGDSRYSKQHKAKEIVKEILGNTVIGDDSHIDAIGYRYFDKKSKQSATRMKYSCVFFSILDDRNFWLERWGLRAIKDKIDSWQTINKLPDNTDWVAGYCDFCKTKGCLLDIDTINGDSLHKERVVVGVDGKVLLVEENDCTLVGEDGDEDWSNPNYGKKEFHEIIEEHYCEYAVHLDVNS